MRRKVAEQVLHETDAEGWPVFKCEVTPNPDFPRSTLWRFRCPYCRGWHQHGNGPGHRLSHCTSKLGQRMMPGGYMIEQLS